MKERDILGVAMLCAYYVVGLCACVISPLEKNGPLSRAAALLLRGPADVCSAVGVFLSYLEGSQFLSRLGLIFIGGLV